VRAATERRSSKRARFAGKVYLASYAHRFGATGLTFFDLVVAVGDSPRLHGGG
jgi:hypothetical protein